MRTQGDLQEGDSVLWLDDSQGLATLAREHEGKHQGAEQGRPDGRNDPAVSSRAPQG